MPADIDRDEIIRDCNNRGDDAVRGADAEGAILNHDLADECQN